MTSKTMPPADHRAARPTTRKPGFLVTVLLGFLLVFATMTRAANGEVDHLLQLGIKMFPTLVGGDLELTNQKNEAGKLLLLVLYQENRTAGEEVLKRLQGSVQTIYKLPVQIVLTDPAGLANFDKQPVAGIFCAEPLSPFPRMVLIKFGLQKKSIVFSPFAGEVQQGILSGLHISTQVQPALNLTTLNAMGMHINPLFFKVAKTYE
ncbi:MAG: hypothetical protein HQL91_12675 [Magnetococcales bacterium]|nr:hypothetical protein [Magnetococcales bacterium]